MATGLNKMATNGQEFGNGNTNVSDSEQIDLVDEDDMLGITRENQDSQNMATHGDFEPSDELETCDDMEMELELIKEKTKTTNQGVTPLTHNQEGYNETNQEGYNEKNENNEPEARNLRNRSKKDYKSLASGRVTPTETKQSQKETKGGKAPKKKKTRNKTQEDKPPKRNHGEKAPKDHGEKAPKENSHGEKAPKDNAHGEKAPKDNAPGEKAPKDTSRPGTSQEHQDEENSDSNSNSEESSDEEWKLECASLRRENHQLKKVLEEEAKENKATKRKLKRKTDELEAAKKQS